MRCFALSECYFVTADGSSAVLAWPQPRSFARCSAETPPRFALSECYFVTADGSSAVLAWPQPRSFAPCGAETP